MGYFSNGTEGLMYEEQYCSRCVHQETCTVLLAHLLHNYEECNNEKSILHILIPLSKEGRNLKCTMFHEKRVTRPRRKTAQKQLMEYRKMGDAI